MEEFAAGEGLLPELPTLINHCRDSPPAFSGNVTTGLTKFRAGYSQDGAGVFGKSLA